MIIVLNNKSNLTKDEYYHYINLIDNIDTSFDLILCPSFINIALKRPLNIVLGSQDVSITPKGAYTGDVSAEQLKSYNIKYCLVGHSERRNYHKETSKEINLKIKKLLEQEIIPILCIGESEKEKNNNYYEKELKKELASIMIDLNKQDQEKIIIAYEPIWAIGTGLVPTPEHLNTIIKILKENLPNNKIIYGGSVNCHSLDTFTNISSLDGFLLGALSLKAFELKKFINKLEKLTD